MDIKGLFLAAIVIEGIVSYIKPFFIAEEKFQWQVLLSIGLGILVAVSYQLDIFNLFGMKSVIPYVGIILTGILISRGSNYVYDIFKLVMNLQARFTSEKV